MSRKNRVKKRVHTVCFPCFAKILKIWKIRFLSIRLLLPKKTSSKKVFLSRFFLHNRLENRVFDTYCGNVKVQEISKRHPKRQQWYDYYSWHQLKAYEIIVQTMSLQNQNMSQNLKHDLHVLKTPNPTNSKSPVRGDFWTLFCSTNMIAYCAGHTKCKKNAQQKSMDFWCRSAWNLRFGSFCLHKLIIRSYCISMEDT